MKNTFRKMMREQIQSDLNNPSELINKPIPRGGWINIIRQILGITHSQLAKKLGCSQQNITSLERREREKTISLKSLEDAAQAMNCKLVYFFLPEKSFNEILKDRAHIIAKKQLRHIDYSMELEQQGLTSEQKKQEEKELVKELLDGNLKLLWQDEDKI